MVPQTLFAQQIVVEDGIAGLAVMLRISDYEANSSYNLVIQPPFGNAIILPVQTTDRGNATAHVSGDKTTVAGMYSAYMEQEGTRIGQVQQFAVLTDSLSTSHSTVEADTARIEPNSRDQAIVSVILRDKYDNPLPNRPVSLISSRGSDTVTPVTSETDETGAQTFTLTSSAQGTIVLRALDLLSGDVLASELTLQAGQAQASVPTATGYPGQAGYYPYPVYPFGYGYPLAGNLLGQVSQSFGALAGFEISAPTLLDVNEDATMNIRAVDSSGNTVEDYTGTVLLTSTDPSAFLPLNGSIPFSASNLGEKTLTLGLRFKQPGLQTLRAVDSSNNSVLGELDVQVQGRQTNNAIQTITITSPAPEEVLRDNRVIITGQGPEFINFSVIEIIDGQEIVLVDSAGTTADGDFSVAVTLDPLTEAHTLQIRDSFGGNESTQITIYLDTMGPMLQEVFYEPTEPIAGEPVTVQVQSDIDASLSLQFADQNIDLTGDNAGRFRATFTAPAAGEYQVNLLATDPLGNVSEETTNLLVKEPPPPPLPAIANIRTEAGRGEITLEWDPITDIEFDAYAIYVGSSPDNFPNRLLGDKNIPNAIIGELDRAKPYYFYVTAVRDEEESEEFEVISDTTLGLKLDIIPDDSMLRLDWNVLKSDVPISAFYLDYGIEPENYSEQRTLNGDIRQFELMDLINNVTYYLQITPLDQAGRPINELVAFGEGTPYSALPGFRPAASEVPPFTYVQGSVRPSAPPLQQQEPLPIPQNTDTGSNLPLGWIATGILAVASMLWFYQRRQRKSHTQFLQMMQERYSVRY